MNMTPERAQQIMRLAPHGTGRVQLDHYGLGYRNPDLDPATNG